MDVRSGMEQPRDAAAPSPPPLGSSMAALRAIHNLDTGMQSGKGDIVTIHEKEMEAITDIVQLLRVTDEKEVRARASIASTDETVETKLAVAERIKQGFEKFKEETYTKNPEIFSKLSYGQCPKLMVIACSDSRVCPATILGLQLGEAFVVRNVANMVPPPEDVGGYPGTSAAVEYAVRELKVEHILVIGHSRCGGIKALVTEKARSSTFIQDWIKIGEPARASTLGSAEQIEIQCTKCEKESVNVSLSNLLAFPFVNEAVTSSKVALHGGYYNFVEGSFEYWTYGADRKPGKVTKF